MSCIKNQSLLYAALGSLSLHGFGATLVILSFSKDRPEKPPSFDVVWESPSSLTRKSTVENTLQTVISMKVGIHSRKKTVFSTPRSKNPKFGFDIAIDSHLCRNDKKRSGDGKPDRHCEASKEPKQSRSPIKTGFLHSAGNNETQRTQLHQPLPSYPWVCRKRCEEGVVCLHVQTNKEGRVTAVCLHKSSGYALLDEAALEAVKSWTFEEKNLQKILSIAFRLKGKAVSLS